MSDAAPPVPCPICKRTETVGFIDDPTSLMERWIGGCVTCMRPGAFAAGTRKGVIKLWNETFAPAADRDAVLEEATAACEALEDKGWRTDDCIDAIRALKSTPAPSPRARLAVGERMFPVLFGGDRGRLARLDCPREVPWALLAPHEEWALNNHDQSLERLASRGGLDPREMVAIIDHRGLRYVLGMDLTAAVERIKTLTATPQSLTPSGQTDVGTGGTSGREVVDTEAADVAHDMALPECRDGVHVGTCRHASHPPTAVQPDPEEST